MKASPGSCAGVPTSVVDTPQNDDGAHEPTQRLGRRLEQRQGWSVPRLIQGLSAMLLLASVEPLGAQEPDLRVRKAASADVVVDILPDASLPTPDAWNLYRGNLVDVASYLQRGDPDGRCDVPGSDASISLAGELAIAGNVYYLLTAMPPGAPETGLGTEGIAIGSDGTLFIGSPSNGGVIVGPDGAVYYSDFNAGRVYRVDDLGTRTTVAASLDGIAKDETGRFYLGDNGNGRLLRYDAAWGNEEVLLTGIGAAANIAFGHGALNCTDVYVASSGTLGLFNGDATGRS